MKFDAGQYGIIDVDIIEDHPEYGVTLGIITSGLFQREVYANRGPKIGCSYSCFVQKSITPEEEKRFFQRVQETAANITMDIIRSGREF